MSRHDSITDDFPILFNRAVNELKVGDPGNPINNRIQIQLPQGRSFVDCQAALESLYMYYSFFNVSSAQRNNILSWTWGATNYAYYIPDGFYEFTELNDFLHECMNPAIRQPQIAYVAVRGSASANTGDQFLLDASSNPFYLLNLVPDIKHYAVTAIGYGIPTGTPPTGYTFPSGYVDPGAYPVSGGCYLPQLIFESQEDNVPTALPAGVTTLGTLDQILGMGGPPQLASFMPRINGFNGLQTTGVTSMQIVGTNSPFPPEVVEFSAIIVNFNLVNSPAINLSSQALAAFSPNVAFGSQIQIIPPSLSWLPLAAPNATILEISFTYDDGTPVNIQGQFVML